MSLIKEINEESVLKTKFTTTGSIVMLLLTMALILLGERVLYDVARAFTKDTIGSFGYFTNGDAILAHVVVVFPVLIFTFLLNYLLGQRKQKYAIILFPYFVTSAALAIQLALELGWFFALNHNKTQFYTVMSLLVLTTSFAIYFIQKGYKTENQNKMDNAMFVAGLLLFGLFTFIILGFGKEKERPNDLVNTQNQIFDQYQQDNSQTMTDPVVTTTSSSVVERGAVINQSQKNSPRIMYWYGKVNQHWNVDLMRWETDPDGRSGANIDKLTYCKKFYPNTVSVVPYTTETIDTWRSGGNSDAYTASIVSDLCVQGD